MNGLHAPNRHAGRVLGPLALMMALAASPQVRAQGTATPFPRDNHAFRYILEQLDLRPITEWQSVVGDPGHTVVIVFGRTAELATIPGGLRSFISKGGALFIATNLRTDLKKELAIQVTGSRVELEDSGSSRAYRQLAECPLVEASDREPAIFEGLDRIATNRPSHLFSTRLPRLAKFPRDCKVEGSMLARTGTLLDFAAGGVIGDGRVLVLSDRNIFINEMMLQTDNQNFDFAYNCVRWLTESGKRTQVLFLDDGQIVTDFTVPVNLTVALPEFTVEFIDRLVAGLEDESLFDGMLFPRFSVYQVYAALAIAITVAGALFGFHRLTQAKVQIEPEMPLAGSEVPQATGGVVGERHQAMLRVRNLWEAARDLAHDTFASAGHERVLLEETVPAVHIAVSGGWRQDRFLRGLAQRFWHLAKDENPTRVSPRQFAHLVRQAEELKSALREGRLQLELTGRRHDGESQHG